LLKSASGLDFFRETGKIEKEVREKALPGERK
jgi:hypothetical protein